MYRKIKGPVSAETNQQDSGVFYKELIEDACKHVRAGLPLKDFYAKHEPSETKSNLLIQHAMVFINMWKNFSSLKE